MICEPNGEGQIFNLAHAWLVADRHQSLPWGCQGIQHNDTQNNCLNSDSGTKHSWLICDIQYTIMLSVSIYCWLLFSEVSLGLMAQWCPEIGASPGKILAMLSNILLWKLSNSEKHSSLLHQMKTAAKTCFLPIWNWRHTSSIDQVTINLIKVQKFV